MFLKEIFDKVIVLIAELVLLPTFRVVTISIDISSMQSLFLCRMK